jgi:DNA-binding FadR family transcriptional regulator
MGRTRRHDIAAALRERIVTGIHVGRYRGGERLPSVRQLAREFDVNERVILAALRELATDGFAVLRPRSGAYVAAPHLASVESLPEPAAWLVTILMQARSRGVPPKALSLHLRRVMETREVRAACIECNRDQLHLLCEELTSDHGFVADSTHLDHISADRIPPSLRRADLLATTNFHADRIARLAAQLKKPWIAIALRGDVMRDVAAHLRRGPLYYVATDARCEKKLRRMLSQVAPIANLRVLLIGRDDLRSIPAGSPTFIMPSAREHMRKRFAEVAASVHQIQPARHFAEPSARELLAFKIRANIAALTAGPLPRK